MIPQILHSNTLISAPKIHTDLLWDLALLFAVVAVVYFFFVFFFRNKFKKDNKQRAALKQELAPMVSEFLFYKEQEGTKNEKNSYIHQKVTIRELIKDKTNRDVLSEILLDLKKDVSGDTRNKLFKLYKELNLDLDAFHKLKSWRWQRVSQGMFELTQMQVIEAYVFISRFINDKRSVIRKQAEISTVTLKPEGISYFLDTTRFQISEWQQLKILEVLSNFENFQPPRFSNWLTAKNKHVVLFALRLIKHYDQSDTEQALIALVRHKNNHIKQEAIHCITKFNFQNARSTLKAVFAKSTTTVKLVILDAIASFQQKEDISFLEELAQTDTDFIVKSKAISTINSIMPGYVMPTDDLEEITEETNLTEKTTSAEEWPQDQQNTGTEKVSLEENHIVEYRENEAFVIDFSKDEIIPVDENQFENYEKTNLLHEFLSETEEINTVQTSENEQPKEEIIDTAFFADINFVKMDTQKEDTEDPASLQEKTIAESVEVDNEVDFSLAIGNSQEEITIHEALDLSVDHQSIFKSLFEASDDYCKLLLLDEILAVGDYKEIAFLQSLHNHHHPEIRTKALVIKAKLLETISNEASDQPLTYVENKVDIVKIPNKENAVTEESPKNTNLLKEEQIADLQPLEFCFLLNQLEIEPAKPKRFDVFEVEFDIDFSEDFNTKEEIEDKDNLKSDQSEERLTPEEHSFFQRLLHFPYKLEDKPNG